MEDRLLPHRAAPVRGELVAGLRPGRARRDPGHDPRQPPDGARLLARVPDPNRYWHGPGGFRYWTSAGIFPDRGDTILNPTDAPDDTRPLADGGQPIRDWGGCPWEPKGSHVYEWVQVERRYAWWPSAAALAAGYKPCRACLRRPLSS